MAQFPPKSQRAALLEFAILAGTSPDSLRLDGGNYWQISGTRGSIYPTRGGGFQIVVLAKSATDRSWAAKRLSFCRPGQGRREEGCLVLDRLPTQGEAQIIRAVVWIPKRIEQKALAAPARAA